MTEDELAAIRARVGVAEANVVRNDVRALLAEVARLREVVEAARSYIDNFGGDTSGDRGRRASIRAALARLEVEHLKDQVRAHAALSRDSTARFTGFCQGAESMRARAAAVCDRSMSDCLCAESEMPCGACLEATRIAVHIRSLPLTDDAEGT